MSPNSSDVILNIDNRDRIFGVSSSMLERALENFVLGGAGVGNGEKARRRLTFGIDLGGTSVRVGLYDEDMRRLAKRTMSTCVAAGPQACVDELASAIRDMGRECGATGIASEIVGVGIGSPGPLNLRTGVLGSLPNFPGWDNFPLRDALVAATGLPVMLECDANAAAIAEWKIGAGAQAGLQSMVMLTLGTGVGSGLILNGKIWHGMFGMGGEVGHATVEPNGLRCGCGTRGCLEMYASANGLLRLARAAARAADGASALKDLIAHSAEFTPKDVASLAQAGDPAACAAYARLGFYLGVGIANLISVLDVPMIVIGGGVAAAWPLFAPAMFQSVREYSAVYRLVAPLQLEMMEDDRTYIRPAKLGSSAGLLGAALLPVLEGMSSMLSNGRSLQETGG